MNTLVISPHFAEERKYLFESETQPLLLLRYNVLINDLLTSISVYGMDVL